MIVHHFQLCPNCPETLLKSSSVVSIFQLGTKPSEYLSTNEASKGRQFVNAAFCPRQAAIVNLFMGSLCQRICLLNKRPHSQFCVTIVDCVQRSAVERHITMTVIFLTDH
mmetsp:Transcript_41770/g.73496  ORF Transcript_41770/g.73496 Transcript_41770/m.73496 type:complete len:110 (-) Transcript_41770:419-748(-)